MPNKTSDKIIELLILQELHALITQNLYAKQDEKKMELVYRSCIDLISIAIVSRLEIETNKKIFTTDADVIFPKQISNSTLAENTSNILVEKNGRSALFKGLDILGSP